MPKKVVLTGKAIMFTLDSPIVLEVESIVPNNVKEETTTLSKVAVESYKHIDAPYSSVGWLSIL